MLVRARNLIDGSKSTSHRIRLSAIVEGSSTSLLIYWARNGGDSTKSPANMHLPCHRAPRGAAVEIGQGLGTESTSWSKSPLRKSEP
jgi:hypothetical protein